jgi:hypothetical protein
MSDADNVELQAPVSVVREVFLQLQNSSSMELYVTTFALTNGYWDPTAPDGIPIQGYAIAQGQTATWGNYTSTAFTSVSGNITFNTAGAGTIVASWAWAYGSNPSASVGGSGTRLKASASLGNQGSNQVTAYITVTGG